MHPNLGDGFMPWLTVIYLDQLLFGSICALLIAQRSPIVDHFRSGWWCWSAFAINLIIGKFGWFTSHDVCWHLQTSMAALLTAFAILHHAVKPELLSNNFIAWLGRISFSIYLVHGMVLDYIPTGQILDKFRHSTYCRDCRCNFIFYGKIY
jgi:peptidoglycan/LPS O-acetylase OafA/YrhL